MNTTPAARGVAEHRNGLEHDFTELQQAQTAIEHLSIPGYLRRIPYKWHMEDIQRFGDKVGRVAESMHLAYMTTTDAALGVIRIFPVRLMDRVYEILSAQYQWPRILDAEAPPALADQGRTSAEALKAQEKVAKFLRGILPIAEGIELQTAFALVLQWLDSDCERMRGELGEEAAKPSA